MGQAAGVAAHCRTLLRLNWQLHWWQVGAVWCASRPDCCRRGRCCMNCCMLYLNQLHAQPWLPQQVAAVLRVLFLSQQAQALESSALGVTGRCCCCVTPSPVVSHPCCPHHSMQACCRPTAQMWAASPSSPPTGPRWPACGTSSGASWVVTQAWLLPTSSLAQWTASRAGRQMWSSSAVYAHSLKPQQQQQLLLPGGLVVQGGRVGRAPGLVSCRMCAA